MQRPLVVFLLLILLAQSCKKPANTSPAKFTGCRISQITETPADTTTTPRNVYHFYYNSDGTVQHLYVYVSNSPYTSYHKYFSYRGGYVSIRTVYGMENATEGTDSVALDAQNRVIYFYHGYLPYSSYSNPQWDGYVYDGTGSMVLHTANTFGNLSMDTLLWQDGDPVVYTHVVQGTGTTDVYTNTYNDTLYNTGNATVDLRDFEQCGRRIYTSKHLLTRVSDANIYANDTIKTYAYGLDTGGRIVSVAETVNGSLFNTTQVVYECE